MKTWLGTILFWVAFLVVAILYYAIRQNSFLGM